MMRMITQKTYRAMFSQEDKEKNREVIKYLEDLYDETFQYLFEIVNDGRLEKISCCEISTFIAFLHALEKNDFKIIPYEWQE
jgi:hypothetical protein